MTLWSFEVPFPHLQVFEPYQDFHFVLSKSLRECDDYRRHIEHVSREGLKTIWLDNNYNETFQADKPEDLIDLFVGSDIRMQKVISPDDPKWSSQEIHDAYETMRDYLTEEAVICVVNSFQMYLDLKRSLGYSPATIAVSYWTREQWNPLHLMAIRAETNLHFLGFLNPLEVQKVRPNSCDTSMPIKLALIGQTMHEWCEQGCKHINTADLGPAGLDFFHTVMTRKQIDLAIENIKTIKEKI